MKTREIAGRACALVITAIIAIIIERITHLGFTSWGFLALTAGIATVILWITESFVLGGEELWAIFAGIITIILVAILVITLIFGGGKSNTNEPAENTVNTEAITTQEETEVPTAEPTSSTDITPESTTTPATEENSKPESVWDQVKRIFVVGAIILIAIAIIWLTAGVAYYAYYEEKVKMGLAITAVVAIVVACAIMAIWIYL